MQVIIGIEGEERLFLVDFVARSVEVIDRERLGSAEAGADAVGHIIHARRDGVPVIRGVDVAIMTGERTADQFSAVSSFPYGEPPAPGFSAASSFPYGEPPVPGFSAASSFPYGEPPVPGFSAASSFPYGEPPAVGSDQYAN